MGDALDGRQAQADAAWSARAAKSFPVRSPKPASKRASGPCQVICACSRRRGPPVVDSSLGLPLPRICGGRTPLNHSWAGNGGGLLLALAAIWLAAAAAARGSWSAVVGLMVVTAGFLTGFFGGLVLSRRERRSMSSAYTAASFCKCAQQPSPLSCSCSRWRRFPSESTRSLGSSSRRGGGRNRSRRKERPAPRRARLVR